MSRRAGNPIGLVCLLAFTTACGRAPIPPTSAAGWRPSVVTDTPIPTITAARTVVPPTRTAIPPPADLGPLHWVASLTGIIPDNPPQEVIIRAPLDGSVWLLTSTEAVRWDGRVWNVVRTESDEAPSDVDSSGRLWVLPEGAAGIDLWQEGLWTRFGAESGWMPGDGSIGGWWIPRPWRVHTAADGGVWLSTDRDVRRFDGSRWTISSLEDMGFPAPEWEDAELVHQLGLTEDGQVWVGQCGFSGPGPTASQGVRWFDGSAWRTVNWPVRPTCVTTVDVDQAGDLWFGAKDVIWQYQTALSDWTAHRLPEEALGEYNFTYPRDLLVDASGGLWVILQYCGGASCDAFSRVYHVQAGEWSLLLESTDWYVPLKKLLLDDDGHAWLFWEGILYRLDASVPEPVAEMPFRGAGAGWDGRVWIAAGSGADAGLWVLDPDISSLE